MAQSTSGSHNTAPIGTEFAPFHIIKSLKAQTYIDTDTLFPESQALKTQSKASHTQSLSTNPGMRVTADSFPCVWVCAVQRY